MIGLLSIVALGFFLGMRHATDPDHVIAVTTIVSRYKKVGHAAMIGAFWGIGHTLTIFVVGSGIILFGWVIPTRIGLSMEFSVGLMLILLGVLNLTGMLQWITSAFSGDGKSASTGTGHSHPHSHGDYVHTHPHQHNPDAHPHAATQTPLGWFDRHFGQIGLYQVVRPLVVGSCPRACRVSGGGAFGSYHDSESEMGGGLSAGFWNRHDCGDDAHHRSDGDSLRVCRQPLRSA